MREKKRDYYIKEQLTRIEDMCVEMKARLIQMGCPHPSSRIEFVDNDYLKQCLMCGKVLENYPSRKSFLAAKLKHTQNQYAEEEE